MNRYIHSILRVTIGTVHIGTPGQDLITVRGTGVRTLGTTQAFTGTPGTGIPGIMTRGIGDVRATIGAGITTRGIMDIGITTHGIITTIMVATTRAGTHTAGTAAETDIMSTAA